MKLVTFSIGSEQRIGALSPGGVVDLAQAVARYLAQESRGVSQSRAARLVPGDMVQLLSQGDEVLNICRQALASREGAADGTQDILPMTAVRVLAPVTRPGKILGVGRNYGAHAKEAGLSPSEQKQPRIFAKFSSSVIGPDAGIPKPKAVEKLDYETELAVVIGKRARNVSEAEAGSVIAGYTIVNDVSARELQLDVNPPQTSFAKSMDGFCPMGPCLVTPDELPDPGRLHIKCWLNGELVQDGNTADMIFSVPYTISYLSRFLTLEPGDVLATGTPPGVGVFRKPPRFLRPGDHLRMDISGIGSLTNVVVEGL